MRANHESESFLSQLRLILLSFIIVSPAILPGLAYGFSAIALPQLQLTLSEASWFASFPIIGCFFGTLISGYVIDKHGRKPCLVISVIPSVIGWFLLTIPYTPFRANTGRFLTGLTAGATSYASSVYLAECIVRHRLKIRSSFTTWSTVALTFGICSDDLLGPFLRYDTVALIYTFLSIVFVILIITFIPESPIWLYQNGRVGDAEWAVKYLRVHTLVRELEGNSNLSGDLSLPPDQTGVLNLLKRKDVYKPLIITTTLLSFAMLSGGMVLVTYMVDIINTNTLGLDNSYNFTAISGVLQLVISASLTFILPHTGNRKLTMFSSIGMTIGMSLIAFTATWDNATYQYAIDLAHTISVLFSISMFSFGFLALPGALLGELFPVEAQGLASIPSLVSFIVNCVIIKVHLYLHTNYGGGIYYGYAVINAIGTVWVYFIMPETVGKTLEEIRNNFK